MAFGRKKKAAGPAGTYAGTNPRYNGGIVDDGVVEERSRCCCFKIARAALMTITLLTLSVILGLSIAALVGGYRKYMFYRRDNFGGLELRSWIGWYKFSRSDFPANTYAKLKSLSVAGYVLGLVTAGFLGGSALLAAMFVLMTCCGRSRSLACIALPFSFLMFGVLSAFYIANCIYYSRQVRAAGIPGKHIPWPSWAWCLGIAASLLWLIASIFMLGTPSKTVMKPSKRVYDAEAAAPVLVSQPPLAGKGYTSGGAPQTVAAPAGASLGTVQPVPVSTSKFGRFRKTGKPTASSAIPLDGTSTTVVTQSTTTAVAPIATETTTAPSYAPNYGGVAGNEAEGGLGRGAWASKGGLAGGNGTTVV